MFTQICEQLRTTREKCGVSYFTYSPHADRYRKFVQALGWVVKRLARS